MLGIYFNDEEIATDSDRWRGVVITVMNSLCQIPKYHTKKINKFPKDFDFKMKSIQEESRLH